MPDDALADRLAAIEARALKVYARHGLPTRPGHYRRGPRAAKWSWLAEDLDPADRWALVLEKQAGSGWRFGTLETLGAGDPRLAVAAAARDLTDCRLVREGLEGLAGPEAIEAALRLGVGLAAAPSRR